MIPGIESKVDVIDAYQILNSLNYIKKNPKEIHNGVLSAESAFELFKNLGVRKEKLKDEEGFFKTVEEVN